MHNTVIDNPDWPIYKYMGWDWHIYFEAIYWKLCFSLLEGWCIPDLLYVWNVRIFPLRCIHVAKASFGGCRKIRYSLFVIINHTFFYSSFSKDWFLMTLKLQMCYLPSLCVIFYRATRQGERSGGWTPQCLISRLKKQIEIIEKGQKLKVNLSFLLKMCAMYFWSEIKTKKVKTCWE